MKRTSRRKTRPFKIELRNPRPQGRGPKRSPSWPEVQALMLWCPVRPQGNKEGLPHCQRSGERECFWMSPVPIRDGGESVVMKLERWGKQSLALSASRDKSPEQTDGRERRNGARHAQRLAGGPRQWLPVARQRLLPNVFPQFSLRGFCSVCVSLGSRRR